MQAEIRSRLNGFGAVVRPYTCLKAGVNDISGLFWKFQDLVQDRPLCLMKLRCAEFLAAFERHFSFKILQVATNTRNSSDFVAGAENHGGVFGFQIARHSCAIVSTAVTNVTDGYVEMIAPKKWRSDELLACAENVA